MPLGTITIDATREARHVLLVVAAPGATELTVTRNGIPVRGAFQVSPTAGGWVGADWEAPQGVDLVYEVTADDGAGATDTARSTPVRMDYGGDWILPVLRPELGMRAIVEFGGVGVLEHPNSRSVSNVLNRPDPVSVTFGRKLWNGTLTFLTLEDSDRHAFLRILGYPVVLFQARPGFGFDGAVYLALGSVQEERTTGLGSESSRRWFVECQQVGMPPAELVSVPVSESWADAQARGTWGDIFASGDNWLNVAGWA